MIRQFFIDIRDKKDYSLVKTIDLNKYETEGLVVEPTGMGVVYTNYINNSLGQEDYYGGTISYENITLRLLIKQENYQTFWNDNLKYLNNNDRYFIILKYKNKNDSTFYYKDVVLERITKTESSGTYWNLPITFNSIGGWYQLNKYTLNSNRGVDTKLDEFNIHSNRTATIIIYLPDTNSHYEITNTPKDNNELPTLRMVVSSNRDKQLVISGEGFIDYDDLGVEFDWEGSEGFEDLVSQNLYLYGNNETNELKVKNIGTLKTGILWVKTPVDYI